MMFKKWFDKWLRQKINANPKGATIYHDGNEEGRKIFVCLLKHHRDVTEQNQKHKKESKVHSSVLPTLSLMRGNWIFIAFDDCHFSNKNCETRENEKENEI